MSEVKIMEYNGKYRIEEGRTKDDKWYAEKCMKQVWNEEKRTKEFSDKVGNLSIKLGDKATAEDTLLQLLQELTGDEYFVIKKGKVWQQNTHGESVKQVPIDQVPF